MIAKNRMWLELKQAKANIVCLLSYTDKKRKWFRAYNVLLITTSSLGALLSIKDSVFAVIASSIIAVASIIKTAMPNIIQSEQELAELDRLLEYYNKYMNQLEEIWYKRFKSKIEDEEMMNLLFAIKHEECEKYTLLNKGIRSISKKEQTSINQQCEKYINEVYFERE